MTVNDFERNGQAAVPSQSIEIAAWYWESRGCNELADLGDIMEITRKINGGTIGFPQRVALYEKFKAIMRIQPVEAVA